MISAILGAAKGALEFINAMFRRRERQEAEAVGAVKQRAVNDEATIKAQREQLEKALNRPAPEDASAKEAIKKAAKDRDF